MKKYLRGSLLVIGILNIISGILNSILILALSIFGLIAGVLYFLFAFTVFLNSYHKLKWVFYLFILPLTVLHWPLFIWSGTAAAPPGYKMSLIDQIVFIGVPLITCLGNIFLLRTKSDG